MEFVVFLLFIYLIIQAPRSLLSVVDIVNVLLPTAFYISYVVRLFQQWDHFLSLCYTHTHILTL